MRNLRILTDEIESDPILNFENYGENIAKIVRNSTPKFSIGIFGEWGTGKTTLMKLIEKKLQNYVKEQVFEWEDIPNNPEEVDKLKTFLIDNYGIKWIENSIVENNGKNIILREDKKIVDSKGSYDYDKSHSISISLDSKKNVALLMLNGQIVQEFPAAEVNNRKKIFLRDNEILTVWFNAWRYEREEQFALIALMKTVAYAMAELPKYREVKKVLLRGLGIIGKDLLRNLALKYAMTEKGLEDLEKNILPKMEILSKVDKDTIYFDGIQKIEEEMHEIIKTNRIVVFIDDLDRCNSKKALEVFESTKIFLDIEGFVFIIGLNQDTLTKLITEEHKQIGIKGDEYLRKIIQVYVNLPRWKPEDIDSLIQKIIKQLDEKSWKILADKDYSELVTTAVRSNPRETKRLINRFIIAHSLDPKINVEQFLITQALESRWSEFYDELNSQKEFRSSVSKYAHYTSVSEIRRHLETGPEPSELMTKLRNISDEIWEFLIKYKKIIGEIIADWETHEQSYGASAEPTQTFDATQKYYNLLILQLEHSGSASDVYNQFRSVKNDLDQDHQRGRVDRETYQKIMELIDVVTQNLLHTENFNNSKKTWINKFKSYNNQ